MEIILDCDLMRHRNSGLYYYCLDLGNHVGRALGGNEKIKLGHYIPTEEVRSFEKKENNIVEKKYHKFFKPFLRNCRIWHAPFQSGRIIPDRKKYKNTKILLTVHDLNALHEGKSAEEQKNSIAHTQDLIDKSDAIVCISDFSKSDVVKYCDVKNKPVHVIHNGIHQLHSAGLSHSSYTPIRPFLFGMGYVNRKKNYHVLLSLLQNSDIELVISGRLDEAEYVDFIKKEAERMGIADRVTLTGPISESEKAWYLSNCLAFVHPSLAEGFGAPVVEAMQFGKPLFLSDKTSLPEIGGEVAFYFTSFAEAHMQDVFRQGMQRFITEEMSAAVVKRSKMFDWKKNAEKYIEVYKTLY